jgi:hypothetical protein
MKNFSGRKMDKKYVLNGQVFKFQAYFYMKTQLVYYDYNMKKFKTCWYILVFHPFENIKNSIIIGCNHNQTSQKAC